MARQEPLDQDALDEAAISLYVSDHATVPIAGEAIRLMMKADPNDPTVQTYQRRARVAVSTYRGFAK